jgi:hypothetical protein
LIHGFCVDHRALLGLDPALDAQRSWTRIYGPDLARVRPVDRTRGTLGALRRTDADQRISISLS